MIIEWDHLSIQEWYDLYSRLPRTNLVQSYAYAKTVRRLYLQNTRFGVIYDSGHAPLGLVQKQQIILGGFERHIIDRGPLWFNEANLTDRIAFWQSMQDQSATRFFFKKRRFLPEEPTEYHPHLESVGLKRKSAGYQTIWLDLTPEISDLRKKLNRKWRNALNRAEDNNLKISISQNLSDLNGLLHLEKLNRAQKKYAGASPKFMRLMHQHRNAHEYGFVLSAHTQRNIAPCATMYFYIHGKSATYQIGWSNDNGRSLKAHYALLWQAIGILKDKGITSLDLGGINPQEAPGVTHFKKGLGGDIFETPGLYI